MKGELGAMMARHFGDGRVEGIFARPERRAEPISLPRSEVTLSGLSDDHSRAGKRAITLLQAEHLPVISALLGGREIHAEQLRRNILVSGLNVLALRKSHVQIGDCVLFVHGPCPPCSRMEEVFGKGGYSAVRGHGGVYCEVLQPGEISLGSPIFRCDPL